MDENQAQLALERRIVEAFIEVIDQKIGAMNGSTMLAERRLALEKLKAAVVEIWPDVRRRRMGSNQSVAGEAAQAVDYPSEGIALTWLIR